MNLHQIQAREDLYDIGNGQQYRVPRGTDTITAADIRAVMDRMRNEPPRVMDYQREWLERYVDERYVWRPQGWAPMGQNLALHGTTERQRIEEAVRFGIELAQRYTAGRNWRVDATTPDERDYRDPLATMRMVGVRWDYPRPRTDNQPARTVRFEDVVR